MKKTWYTIQNAAEESAIVNIHGSIGAWEVSAKDFVKELSEVKAKKISVHINSYGGEVFDGIAIYNALKSHGASIETVVDAVAASIASVIFMAGEKRSVYKTSMLMIHNPLMMSYGNASQLRKDADLLDKIDKSTIKKAYQDAVNGKIDEKEIAELMDDETWFDSDESVFYGFATDIIDAEPEENARDYASAMTDCKDIINGFKKVPVAIMNSIVSNKPAAPSVATAETKPNKEGAMPVEQTPAPILNESEIKTAAVDKERARVSSIAKAAKAFNIAGEVLEDAISSGKSVEDAVSAFSAAKKVQDLANDKGEAVTPKITINADERDKYRTGTVKALCAAAGHQMPLTERADALKQDVPKSIHSLIKSELRREGSMSPNAIDNIEPHDLGRQAIRLAKNAAGVGTGDLTNILADTLNKSLGMGYENSPATFQQWCRVIPVKDFKDYKLVKTSAFSDMDTINESEAFSHGAFTDKKETGSVTVKGKTVTISWQAIVNDDLGAITRIPEIVGSSFRAKQNRDVYYTLFGTGTGPTMTELDSGSATACFTALRGNYATGAGAPSVSTLATARKAMRLMSAPKGEGSDVARPLNLVPSFIIAGAALEQTIETLLMSQNGYIAIDPSGTNLNTYNPFGNGGRTSLQMIIDPVIDAKTTTGWWLAASPAQIETICVLALNGQLMPTIRSEESRVGEALGINWDIYGAYGVMCGDHRGLYYHAGA